MCTFSSVSGPAENALPDVFTYGDARARGLSDRALYEQRDAGRIEAIGRGLYQRTDAEPAADLDLIEIALRAPQATLCLTSALSRHELTDLIPSSIDIALPRGQRKPRTQAVVAWHLFQASTFTIGRHELDIDGHQIGIYTPERCIVDAFRLRRFEGPELGNTALRTWLRQPHTKPATLLAIAAHFPNAEKALLQALEVLL